MSKEKLKENEDVLDMEKNEETLEENNENNNLIEEENETTEPAEVIEEIVKEEKEQEKKPAKNKKVVKCIIAFVSIIFIICLILLLCIFLKTKDNKVLNNVYFENLNLGNKTKEEIKNILDEKYAKDFEKSRNINIKDEYIKEAKEIIKKQEERGLIEKDGEYKQFNESINHLKEYTISPKDIDFKIYTDKIAEDAYNVGRNDGFFSDAKAVIKSLLNKKTDVKITNYKYDEDKLLTTFSEIDGMLPGKIMEVTYVVDNDKLIVTNGEEGFALDKDKTKAEIMKNFLNVKESKIDLMLDKKMPKKLSADEIHNKTKQDVKDASFNSETKKVEKEVVGIDFAISIEEAEKIINEDKDKHIIPLKITKPKVLSEQFEQHAFKDILATYTANSPGCGAARAKNLAIGSRKINGTIVNPGEEFSFIRAVGDVSAATGYAAAGVFTAKGVEMGVGGGICQVVSTVYNAALLSGMDILQRHQHSYVVGYVPRGRDATMYAPSKDLRFRNSLSRPIKVVAWANGGSVTVQIKGIDEGVKGEVSSTSSFVSRQVERIPDPSLPEGKEVRSAVGFDGARSTTYYKLWKQGKLVKNQVIHNDYYKPMGKITIRYGTQKAAPAPAPKKEEPKKPETPKKPAEPKKPEESKKPKTEKKASKI